MKQLFFISKGLLVSIVLLTICVNVKSQTIDSLDNKVCIEKIKEIYGLDVTINGPFDILEIEKKHMVVVENSSKKDSIPFGYINFQWNDIKLKIQEGDKIFEFSTGPDSWQNLSGREGVIVLREDVVVGTIITLLN